MCRLQAIQIKRSRIHRMSLEKAQEIVHKRLPVEIMLAHDAIGVYIAISDHAEALRGASVERAFAIIQRHALASLVLSSCSLFEARNTRYPNFSIPTAIFHLRQHQAELAGRIQEPIKLEQFIQQEIEPSFDLYNSGEMARIPGLLLDHFDTTRPQAEGAIGPLDCVLKALKVLRDKRVAHAEDADIQGMSKTNLDGVSQLLAYAQTFVNLVGYGILGFSTKGVAVPADFQADKSKVWTQMQETINIVEQSSA
jgi:hypothetical protein